MFSRRRTLLCTLIAVLVFLSPAVWPQTVTHGHKTGQPDPQLRDPPSPSDSRPIDTQAALAYREDVIAAQKLLAETAASLSGASLRLLLLEFGLLIVIAVQAIVLAGQGFILFKYVRSQQADYVTRNRPRLVVRHIALELFEAGKLAKVQWVAENMGNSTAMVVEAHATLLVTTPGSLPDIPPYDSRNHAVGGIKADSGVSVPFVQFTHEAVSAQQHDALQRHRATAIYFFGYLLYLDDLGTRRRLGFCREYDPDHGRFVTVDDPNYEYGD